MKTELLQLLFFIFYIYDVERFGGTHTPLLEYLAPMYWYGSVVSRHFVELVRLECSALLRYFGMI